jgi:hypothetical protein
LAVDPITITTTIKYGAACTPAWDALWRYLLGPVPQVTPTVATTPPGGHSITARRRRAATMAPRKRTASKEAKLGAKEGTGHEHL